jgi:hypothetical protein
MTLLSWHDRQSILRAPWRGRLPDERWKAELARGYVRFAPRRTAFIALLIVLPPLLLLVVLVEADPGSAPLGSALVRLPLTYAWVIDVLFVLVMWLRFRKIGRRWETERRAGAS